MVSELDVAGHANDGSSSSESDGCSCMDLTTPLGHETLRSSIDVRELDSETGLIHAISSKISLPFLSFLVFYCVSILAMPTGYKLHLVISCALGILLLLHNFILTGICRA